MNFVKTTLETASRTLYTEAQQDANWENLWPEQRDYFNRLAKNDPERTGQAFFEDTAPAQLQDNPELLDTYFNGGTVYTPEYTFTRGRNGGEFELVEHELPDRDWSHDVSQANGGSDSADNGRFEDASVNRSRGAENSTLTEQELADAASEADVHVLERSVSLGDVRTGADVTLAAEAAEGASALATAGDLALDFLGPALGGACAAKLAADQFESTEAKVAAGGAAGVATAAVLCTPVGQFGLGCYLVYKLAKAGHGFFTKHLA